MTAITEITEQDFELLLRLMAELQRSGRVEEAASVAKAYEIACQARYPELCWDPTDDGRLEAALAEADLEITEGRTIGHDEARRRLGLSDRE